MGAPATDTIAAGRRLGFLGTETNEVGAG
jgi:hypothetical protein